LQYYSNKLNYPYSTMINQVLKEWCQVMTEHEKEISKGDN
jgi:hypothetical protein